MSKEVKKILLAIILTLLVLVFSILFILIEKPRREALESFLNRPSPYIVHNVNFFNGESLYDNIMKTESTLNERETYGITFEERSGQNGREKASFFIKVSKNPDFVVEASVDFWYHDINGKYTFHSYDLDLTPQGFRVKEGEPSSEEMEYITSAKAPCELITINAPTLKELKKENKGKTYTAHYYVPREGYYSTLSDIKLNFDQYNAYLAQRNCYVAQNPVEIEEIFNSLGGTSMSSIDGNFYMHFDPYDLLRDKYNLNK